MQKAEKFVAGLLCDLGEERFVEHFDTVARAAHYLWTVNPDAFNPMSALMAVGVASIRAWGHERFGKRWLSSIRKLRSEGTLSDDHLAAIVVEGANRIRTQAEKFEFLPKNRHWLVDAEFIICDYPRTAKTGKYSTHDRVKPDSPWKPVVDALFGNPDEALQRLGQQLTDRTQRLAERFATRTETPVPVVDVIGLLDELWWRWSDYEPSRREEYLWEAMSEFVQRMENVAQEKFAFTQWSLAIADRITRAWLLKDSSFFERASPFWKDSCAYAGGKRPPPPANEMTRVYRIQREAWHLFQNLGRNPTKKEVRTVIEKQGIRLDSRDWPAQWKRCKLDFLPGDAGGRPPKTSGKPA